ncbi:MFS transporter [Thermoactinomyces sp. CICC 10521]|uniref:MFS transporter n=1 Tax=Thermoactinomyces sp. CICC 10521 TaxID=2767426 RepID=UPI0018DCBD4B|nr:MFS transporter [Thermoactinomyces sp. CICC 10521]MBH8606369.1 MFS transporter [Thermoactinomyces sp. CICC 10521]
MVERWSIARFRILVLIVCVAGMTQGLLIPLLTTLLDEQGINPAVNGLSAAALYIGMLIASPFGARVVKRKGLKWTILFGLCTVGGATILFPLSSNVWIWSFLRLVVGAGDSLLHYATQLWITTTAPAVQRGKRISQYGFAYGLGFGIGPLGMNLLVFGKFMPFLAVLAVLGISLCLSLRLDNGSLPESAEVASGKRQRNGAQLRRIYLTGLVALCPPVLYGFLETALSGNFPVIGLKEGLSKGWISILISAFVWGSLLLQVPLGTLGDRIGRKRILIATCCLGSLGMFLIPLLLSNVIYLLIAFTLIGGFVGSLFSLGLAYATDLLAADDLPAANAIAAMHFSVGSILGPYLGGYLIEWFGSPALFWFIGSSLLVFVLLALLYPVTHKQEEIVRKKAV